MAEIINTNMNNQDPHDPSDRLGATSREFQDRPEHGWQPGDPILTHADMEASMAYAGAVSRAERAKDAVALEARLRKSEAEHRREKKKMRRILAGAVLGTIACVHSFVPGDGLIDRIGASHSSTADTVDDALAEYENDSEFVDAAWRVEAVYEQLDAEGIDSVVQTAMDYREKHSNDFVQPDSLTAYRETIESAGTKEAVAAAMLAFMQEYGIKDVEIEDGNQMEELRRVASDFADIFGPLPLSFVKKAKFTRIALVDELKNDAGKSRAGIMDSAGLMRIDVQDRNTLERARDDMTYTGLGVDRGYGSTIAHEFMHAIEFARDRDGVQTFQFGLPADQYGDKKSEASHFGKNVKDVFSVSEVPSLYSLHDSGEFHAEIMASLLYDAYNDLPSPREWRRFNSELNEHQLRALTELEAMHPGIAPLIIADRFSE